MSRTDLGYLVNMTENNKDVILEMIDIFIDQVESFRIEMYELYAAGNYKALGQLAHKAKSSVSIMGMSALSQKLKELEIKTSENADPEEFISYINYFTEESEEAVIELKEYKKRQ